MVHGGNHAPPLQACPNCLWQTTEWWPKASIQPANPRADPLSSPAIRPTDQWLHELSQNAWRTPSTPCVPNPPNMALPQPLKHSPQEPLTPTKLHLLMKHAATHRTTSWHSPGNLGLFGVFSVDDCLHKRAQRGNDQGNKQLCNK